MKNNQDEVLENLRSLLIKGLYEDNLQNMANLCVEYRKKFQGDYVSILYILENIFYDLYENFHGRPVLENEVSLYEDLLKGKIDNLLDLLIKKQTDMKILFGSTDDLIVIFSKEILGQ